METGVGCLVWEVGIMWENISIANHVREGQTTDPHYWIQGRGGEEGGEVSIADGAGDGEGAGKQKEKRD